MKRCRLLLFGLGFVGLAMVGIGLVIWLTTPKQSIAAVAANPHVIEAGMGLHQVEAVFGVPPGDYTTRATQLLIADPNGDVPSWHATEDWFADHASVRVYFDAEHRVLFARGVIEDRSPETVWQRLRRWLRL